MAVLLGKSLHSVWLCKINSIPKMVKLFSYTCVLVKGKAHFQRAVARRRRRRRMKKREVTFPKFWEKREKMQVNVSLCESGVTEVINWHC